MTLTLPTSPLAGEAENHNRENRWKQSRWYRWMERFRRRLLANSRVFRQCSRRRRFGWSKYKRRWTPAYELLILDLNPKLCFQPETLSSFLRVAFVNCAGG